MSKRELRACIHSALHVVQQQTNLSYASLRDYRYGIKLCVKQLHEGGFGLSNIKQLKEKHVNHLVLRWKRENLTAGAIKNRAAQLRRILRTVGKDKIADISNADWGIAERSYKPIANRAITNLDLNQFSDPLIRCSVALQAEFGLRREESMKFIVSHADCGDYIKIHRTWSKGGIERIIPIRTSKQRLLIQHIKDVVASGRSLIPEHLSYKDQLYRYCAAVQKSDYHNLHGLRHAYAQSRYRELTDAFTRGHGWDCPIKGGYAVKQMNDYEKQVDFNARMVISHELGHSRVAITRIYLG